MKNKFILACIIYIIFIFIPPRKVFAASYNIDTYYGTTPSAPTALLHRGTAPAFAANDTLNFTQNLTASNTGIGSLGQFTLNLNGNNKTIDGVNSFTGFSVLSGGNYKFDGLNLNRFRGGNGGAIYDNQGTITVKNSTFDGNNASKGGAIYNTGTSTNTIDNTIFNHNTASTSGGAIYVMGTTTITDGTFSNNSATTSGGAIFNDSATGRILTLTDTDFSSNSSVNGGALYNSPNTSSSAITRINGGTYESNTATDNGGAIYNSTGATTITGTTFNSNTATNLGGAIYNISGNTFTVTSCHFEDNDAARGGAIYDTAASSTNVSSSTFDSNTASVSGGAIYANGPITLGGTFTGNSATSSGGAIYNTGTATISNGTFDGNYVTSGNGGALYNDIGNTSNVTNSNFTSNDASANGGAIYNDGSTIINGGTYTSNSAANGGAIYNNTGCTVDITNADFSTNSATTNGGAIYNAGTLYLKANADSSLLSGNTANSASNALYNAGTTYLNAGNGGIITFDDAITSDVKTRAINVNSTAGSATLTNGTVNFNNDVTNSTLNISAGTVNFGNNISLAGDILAISGGTSNFINQDLNTSSDIAFTGGTMNLNSGNGGSSYINDKIIGSSSSTININKTVGSNPTDGTVYINKSVTGGTTINMYNGTMALNKESYINGNNLGIYGGTIDTQNGLIGTMALNNVAFLGNANWLIDVDLANVIGDKITSVNPSTGTGTLSISSINLLSDANAVNTAIIVADDHTKNHLSTSVSSLSSSLFNYAVSYDSSGGALNFVKTGVAPGAVTSDVAQTQAFLLQTAIDRQFFANMESFMSFPLAQRESSICCALMNGQATGGACPISGNGTFSPIYSCSMNRGLWVKSFTSFENIPLRNGPNVSTIEYGTLIGMDAPMTYLKKGWVGNTSAYVGYLGSNQNYDNVGVSQNGVLVGLAENLVKGNNFITLMASVGSSMGIANTPYGNDYFNTLFAGAAVKGGHNFEFKKGDYIVQPNLMLAYTFTHTPDYTTASGLDMTSQPLNAMQIAPGLRLIKNLKEEKGQVYVIANFVYNVMDNTRFSANDVQLPQLSIAPYFEYGIGYQRVWKERFTGFFQTLLRGGGRNGVAFQFGMRWAI